MWVKRMRTKKHQYAAHGLDGIGDEHHVPLGHQIGKDANPGGKQHIAHNKEKLQKRRHPLRSLKTRQKGNGCNQKRIVCEARKKLSTEDVVKAAFHG